VTILRRVLRYARGVLALDQAVGQIQEPRLRPQIAIHRIILSTLVMFLTRLGSLNALEQSARAPFWHQWLGAGVPSPDTIARVACQIDPEGPREALATVYDRLKRGKALDKLFGKVVAAALDGHESHATYKRCCDGCLSRQVQTKRGVQTQYYHQYVTLQLIADSPIRLLLDAEPLRPGEGEVAAAKRLLDRVLQRFPRAFDVVLGDSLYADGSFFQFVRQRGKHVLTVLKQENRHLYQDAAGLWEHEQPQVYAKSNGERRCWDFSGFTTWPQTEQPVRVIRCVDTTRRRQQLDKEVVEDQVEWVWVTTLPEQFLPTHSAVRLGQERWSVENQGFNELVTRWYADHVYRHEATAMLVFWLLTMLAHALFMAFYHRNLKPEVRRRLNTLEVVRQIVADLYSKHPPRCRSRSP